ncbi:MAG: acyl-CoA thioesterase [Bacteroidia bacterium]|nr:acyl-CoA thioesterase [Bacteroidia bacterium]
MILTPEDFRFSYSIPMRWSDIDEFRHVNNARYLTYFEECRFRYFVESCQWEWKNHGLILAHISIDYLKPLLFMQNPVGYVACTEMGNKSFRLDFLICNEQAGQKTPVSRGHAIMVGIDYETQETVPILEKYKTRMAEYDVKALAAVARRARV